MCDLNKAKATVAELENDLVEARYTVDLRNTQIDLAKRAVADIERTGHITPETHRAVVAADLMRSLKPGHGKIRLRAVSSPEAPIDQREGAQAAVNGYVLDPNGAPAEARDPKPDARDPKQPPARLEQEPLPRSTIESANAALMCADRIIDILADMAADDVSRTLNEAFAIADVLAEINSRQRACACNLVITALDLMPPKPRPEA